MFPWCHPQASEPAYAVGDTIYSGSEAGTVVSVDEQRNTMEIVWHDSGDGKPITYPMDASYLRKQMPWD